MVLPFQPGPATGARTSVYLASSPEVAATTGAYFVKCKPAKPSALARDPAAAARLWTLSEELAGLDRVQ
jgi:retinol dehydrogenase-12